MVQWKIIPGEVVFRDDAPVMGNIKATGTAFYFWPEDCEKLEQYYRCGQTDVLAFANALYEADRNAPYRTIGIPEDAKLDALEEELANE